MASQPFSGTVRLFGKMPSHGDFIARGFAAADRDALDLWLSTGLDATSAALGPAFAGLYDQAPPWRFAAMEAGGAVAGVLVPSVDQAGRRYPLYLALAGIDVGHVGLAVEWCENLIHDAFRAGWDADRLVQAAAGFVPGAGGMSPADLPCWWLIDGEGVTVAHVHGRWPDRLLSTMLQPQEEH